MKKINSDVNNDHRYHWLSLILSHSQRSLLLTHFGDTQEAVFPHILAYLEGISKMIFINLNFFKQIWILGIFSAFYSQRSVVLNHAIYPLGPESQTLMLPWIALRGLYLLAGIVIWILSFIWLDDDTISYLDFLSPEALDFICILCVFL